MISQKTQQIKQIKNILDQDLGSIDNLLATKKGPTLRTLKMMMKNGKTVEQQQQSEKISKKLNARCRAELKQNLQSNHKKKDIKLKLMRYLQQVYTNLGFDVLFQEHSDSQSKLTIKALTTDMHINFVSVSEIIPENQCKWKPSQLTNIDSQIQFENWYQDRIKKQFNLKEEDICELEIVQGEGSGITVQWMTTQGAILEYEKQKKEGEKMKKMNIHRLFKQLYIAEDDYFSNEGDLNFSQLGQEKLPRGVMQRGRWPYYQPTIGQRLGVNIQIYGKDKSWIQINHPKQWAVGFHPISSPKNLQNNNLEDLKFILKQLDCSKMPSQMQKFYNKKSVNRNQLIKNGIFFSPHFQTALKSTAAVTGYGKPCCVILQCRLKPESILVCPGQQDTWVVHDPQDIRIYGIILIDEDDGQKFNQFPQKTHGQTFTYQKYRQQIQNKLEDLITN